MNIEIKATELRRAFGTTILWAAEDDSRPALGALHLIVAKHRLWAVAADPFCLAYDSAACTADEGAEVTLPRAAVDFALREIAALPKKVRSEALVQITEAGISVVGAAFAYEPLSGFPNWRQVIPTSSAPTTYVAVNPFFLARLAKVAKLSGSPISTVVLSGPLGPLDIQVGETFRVIVMPIRIAKEVNVAELPPLPKVEAAA